MTAADVSLNLKDPVCVSSCPGVPSALGGSLYAPVPECKLVSASQQINSYKTMIIMNRYCFPDSSGLLKNAANSLESGLLSQHTERLMEQLSSIPAAWPVLLIAFFLAVLLGYMYLVALRHCTVLLIWLVMALWLPAPPSWASTSGPTRAPSRGTYPAVWPLLKDMVTTKN